MAEAAADAFRERVFAFARESLTVHVSHMEDVELRDHIKQDSLAAQGFGIKNGEPSFLFHVLSLLRRNPPPFYRLRPICDDLESAERDRPGFGAEEYICSLYEELCRASSEAVWAERAKVG